MTYNQIIKKLKSMRNEKNKAGMKRYGINVKNALGIPVPAIRKMAKITGKNHELAARLWDSGIHEAGMLAAFIDEPDKVTEGQMEKWARDFDSWDLCDAVCSSLFAGSRYGFKKEVEWAGNKREYVKRAAFTIFAVIAWYRIDYSPAKAKKILRLIKKHSGDERNYVRKAVNWALRNVGKSGTRYFGAAKSLARELEKSGSKTAAWIAKDALREFASPAIRRNAEKREKKFEKRPACG